MSLDGQGCSNNQLGLLCTCAHCETARKIQRDIDAAAQRFGEANSEGRINERERCAKIAEATRGGKKIAEKIRSGE